MSTVHYLPKERRRHTRTTLNLRLHGVRLDPEGGDNHDTLQMVDISRGGMGAVSDSWLYPGQRLVLCLPLRDDGGRRNVFATVLRCQKSQEGYRLGLQFDSISLSQAMGYETVAAAA